MGLPPLGPSPSENLRMLREHRGITLRELERATGIHNASLSKMEKGRYGIGALSAHRLARYFGVDAEALCTQRF